MRFQNISWMDVEHYLQHDDRIMLVTGSTEQHAYLSLLTDVLIPEKIAEAVALREGVLVGPSLNFGVSHYFAEYPGTISLSQMTYDAVLFEMVQSLLQHGFRRFLFLNGHGGNRMPSALHDMEIEGTIRVAWYEWWRGSAMQTFESQHNLRFEHANWGENFPFTRVGDVPEGEKPTVNLDHDGAPILRDVLGDGSVGGRYQIDDRSMMQLFDALVAEVSAVLRGLPPL